jgi:hypothetical protein
MSMESKAALAACLSLLLPAILSGQAMAQQTIRDQSGSPFMEEVTEPKMSRPSQPPVPDFAGLGVPVGESGKIIPLLQPGAGPVMANFSRLEIDYTPPVIYLPYNIYSGPYGYLPRRTPFGVMPVPVYRRQESGALAVPLGIGRSFSSSSDDAIADRQTDFQFSGSYLTPSAGASIWSPAWQSPFAGSLLCPKTSSFEGSGQIRSFFPEDMRR